MTTFAISASRAGTRSVILDGVNIGNTQAISGIGIVKRWEFTPANYVDFAGNIGAVSLYGKLLYGAALYSRGGAFAPAFVGDFDLIGQANFIGDLAPIVSFAGSLTFRLDLGGDLAPSVTFGGNLTFNLVVGGALTPSVTFNADLTFFVDFVPLVGSFTSSIVLGASSFISGPLWPDAETCPPSLWTPVDCDSVDWRKAEVCNG